MFSRERDPTISRETREKSRVSHFAKLPGIFGIIFLFCRSLFISFSSFKVIYCFIGGSLFYDIFFKAWLDMLNFYFAGFHFYFSYFNSFLSIIFLAAITLGLFFKSFFLCNYSCLFLLKYLSQYSLDRFIVFCFSAVA